jgi:tRNA(fMet)-specific endonuclease VapC
MTRLLDTCICIFLIRTKAVSVKERFESFQIGDLGISSITSAELRFGADKSADPGKNHRQLDQFFLTLPILPFDESASRHYGEIRANLERSGTPIGSLDFLIAAHARSLHLIVVTNNQSEFRRVPGLMVEDWSAPIP